MFSSQLRAVHSTRVISSRLIPLLLATFAAAQASAVTVTDGFEMAQTAPHLIGTSPITLTISAGIAQTLGVQQFYHGGSFSLHIRPGETATGTFETDASALSFWARTTAPGVTSLVRVFDENNVEILNQAP